LRTWGRGKKRSFKYLFGGRWKRKLLRLIFYSMMWRNPFPASPGSVEYENAVKRAVLTKLIHSQPFARLKELESGVEVSMSRTMWDEDVGKKPVLFFRKAIVPQINLSLFQNRRFWLLCSDSFSPSFGERFPMHTIHDWLHRVNNPALRTRQSSRIKISETLVRASTSQSFT